MLRRVYAHRVHIDGNSRFAISAPECGISESFDTEGEFESALEKLGFPPGFGREVAVTLERRGIVSLDLDPGTVLASLKSLSRTTKGL